MPYQCKFLTLELLFYTAGKYVLPCKIALLWLFSAASWSIVFLHWNCRTKQDVLYKTPTLDVDGRVLCCVDVHCSNECALASLAVPVLVWISSGVCASVLIPSLRNLVQRTTTRATPRVYKITNQCGDSGAPKFCHARASSNKVPRQRMLR